MGDATFVRFEGKFEQLEADEEGFNWVDVPEED